MEEYIGQISLVGFSFAPRGSAICAGQLLAISQNSALFSLIGTTYGGDGRTTFALPDLQGRAPLGFGQGAGLSLIRMGQKSGSQSAWLNMTNLPVHTHSATATFTPTEVSPVTAEGSFKVCTDTATKTTPSEGDYIASAQAGLTAVVGYIDAASITNSNTVALGGLNVSASGGETSGAVTVQNHTTGGSSSVNIANPYLGMNYVIWEYGIYPSRG
ncbi:phage tail protein [Oceanobacter mangrovi]|uniref:phage tail protein n=1 Tax=Oceanobacter mangrovi TaxID=2862510 RepID=UPI001C8EED9B|nr:tail fiber protein [Oceanobacter mangrovi]